MKQPKRRGVTSSPNLKSKLPKSVLGAAYESYRAGDYESCIALLQSSITPNDLKPEDNIKMRYLLADAQLALRKFNDAICTYTEIILLRPTDVAYANRALAFWETQRFEEALADYLKALKIRPRNEIAHRGAAEMYLRREDHKRAIRHFRSALRLRPQYAAALTGLGVALFQTGKWGEAYRSFQEALAEDPNDDLARRGLQALEDEARE